MFSLEGLKALVTGSATGIGQAIAAMLARQGADVMVSDRPGVSLDESKEKLAESGNRVYGTAIDVRDPEQVKAGVETALSEMGRIDILVNNAGINRPVDGLNATVEEWDDHYNILVRGGFLMAQAAAPGMIGNKWGRIVFISSQSGLIAIPGQPIYCSAKGAVIQLVRTLGVEWAKDGITVNSVAPTFIETNMTRKRLQQPEFRKFVLGKIPAGKLAMPEDIGAAVVYLSSREAGMVNCSTLVVDGGWTTW